MKNAFILLFVLTISFSSTAQSKEESFVKNTTDELESILKLSKKEKSNVYDILLEKELKVSVIKKEHKSNPETRKAEIKKINPIYNRQIKDIIGKEKMALYNDYKKSKRKNK